MTDPRRATSFDGLDYEAQGYQHDGSIVYNAALPGGSAQVGLAATVVSAKTVGLVGDNEPVTGRITKVESDGRCSVQTDGYCVLPAGTAALLTHGLPIVGALLIAARGYIKAGAAGTGSNDLSARGEIVDATVTTAVVVNL